MAATTEAFDGSCAMNPPPASILVSSLRAIGTASNSGILSRRASVYIYDAVPSTTTSLDLHRQTWSPSYLDAKSDMLGWQPPDFLSIWDDLNGVLFPNAAATRNPPIFVRLHHYSAPNNLSCRACSLRRGSDRSLQILKLKAPLSHHFTPRC